MHPAQLLRAYVSRKRLAAYSARWPAHTGCQVSISIPGMTRNSSSTAGTAVCPCTLDHFAFVCAIIEREIGNLEPVAPDGQAYVFDAWSAFGRREHQDRVMFAIEKRFDAFEDEENDEGYDRKAKAERDISEMSPITVMSHKVAAVVTPVTSRSRRTMAPAPMKPTPERIPSGNRSTSIVVKDCAVLPMTPSIRLASIIAPVAARHMRMLVRNPAARPLISAIFGWQSVR